MDEQRHLYKNTNHVANLNTMRLSRKLCDVAIKVNNKKFLAHKVILAANLRYFESMFLNSFQESKQNVVTMHDMEETDVEAFKTYAYTGEILITDSNVLNLLEVANYLNEDNIKHACINFLKMHLKKEDSYRAYKLANAIECSTLKSLAKEIILSNFECCSLTTEYLDLDFENLRDILSYACLSFAELQQIFFEGVVRWILHDTENRKAHVNDLLDLVEITKMNSDYLWQYFCQRVGDQQYSDISKDIMSYCHTKSQQICQLKNQSLIIIGHSNTKFYVQSHDFTKKQWDPPTEIIDLNGKWLDQEAILNNTFYYTVCDSSRGRVQVSLQVFDPTTKLNIMLSFDNRLLRDSAMCACDKFLYLCGGFRDGSQSNQILRYDILTNSFKMLPPMRTKRDSAAAIFYHGCLYVLGGRDSGFNGLNSVEKYDLNTKKWTNLAPMCEKRRWHVAVLGGKLYACGGYESHTVEVYSPLSNRWQLVARMSDFRDDFFVVANARKLLAIGGRHSDEIEVYDADNDQWQIDHELSSGLQIDYPRSGLITSIRNTET